MWKSFSRNSRQRFQVIEPQATRMRRIVIQAEVFDGMSLNMRRQIAGHIARFFPPGHRPARKASASSRMPILMIVILGEGDRAASTS
jgi:hypothetical protein